MLMLFFQVIFNKIDKWVNAGSGLAIESADDNYIDIFVYSALSGSFYIPLPVEFKTQKQFHLYYEYRQ